jgi:hypothetical protein
MPAKHLGLLERDLRDFLSQNLEQIEAGLTLLRKEAYLPAKLGTRGFIDILALDSSGRYVLIEIKRTAGASREAIHEILKYIEGAKRHLGLRETEVRAMIVAAEWAELRIPFLSLVARTSCRVDGYEIELSESEKIRGIRHVGNTLLVADRVLAPWQHIAFYLETAKLEDVAQAYSKTCSARGIESYVLLYIVPADGNDGLTSPQDREFERIFRQMDEELRDNPSRTSPPEPKYRSAIYFAMQQFSIQECFDRLNSIGITEDDLDLWSSSEEAYLEAAHEALQRLDLTPGVTARVETSYPAKFKMLTEKEGWRVEKILRFGAFYRNSQLKDEQIVLEICDAQADSRQSLKFAFNPRDKTELAEAKKRVDICLKDNQPWRLQINLVLDVIAASNDEPGPAEIKIFNSSAAISNVYAQTANGSPRGQVFIPFFFITPGPNCKITYYGAMVWDGTTPSLKTLIKEFYGGDPVRLRVAKKDGGYEPRDVYVARKMGLHYRTFKAVRGEGAIKHYQLIEGLWEPCGVIDFISEYYRFLWSCDNFVQDVRKLYDEWEKWTLII